MGVTKFLASDHIITEEFPFRIAQYHHNSTNTPEEHSHEFIELVYVLEGKAKHVFEGKSYPIQTNDVFIINPGEIHTFNVDVGEALEIVNCLFTSSFIKESLLKELGVSRSMDFFYIYPFLDEVNRFHHFINIEGNHASRFMAILENLMDEYEQKTNCFPTLIRMQLIELLIILSRIYNEQKNGRNRNEQNDHEILAQQISGYLARNYEQKITIPDLCELFNISPRHLSRLFKRETGKTVIEKLHMIRINKAKSLLLEKDYKVIEVALMVGYDEPAFFSRLFQRLAGCSPGKYKEKMTKRFVQNNSYQ